MVLCNAGSEKMIPEQFKKQIGFSAAAKAGDDFDQSIVLFADELVQITVTTNFHESPP